MSEQSLTLTGEERECLEEVLEQTLKETRIEEHRTRAPTYREHIVHRKDLLQGLLTKLATSPQQTSS